MQTPSLRYCLLWLPLFSFLSSGPFLSAQQFYSAAFPDEDGLVELWVPDICGASLQWQESTLGTEEWTDVSGATNNALRLATSVDAIGDKKFRVRAMMPPATVAEYSYEFSVQVIGSLEELGVGQYYDKIFIYENRPDTILGSIFTGIRATYGCNGVLIPEADAYEIGGGIQNTNSLRNNCFEPGSVSTVFDTLALLGYEDWFLPAIDGLSAAMAGFTESDVLQVTEADRAYPFLSSSQRKNRPAGDRFFAIRSGGLDLQNLPKDTEGHVIAARRLTNSDERSHRAQTLWPSYQFPELLTLENTPEGSDKVEVEYQGGALSGNVYDLGTSENLKYQSGEGSGPYVLSNNFGGYQRFELQVLNSGCHTLRLRSPIFKINQAENTEAPFPETHRGEMAWGDYDNDGLIDVLITGTDTTALYRNLGDDQFSWEPASFPALSFSSADWGDLDNDGDLDLALIGLQKDNTPFAGIYRNGEAGFEETTYRFPSLVNGFVKWIDYNRDGQLELLVSGEMELGDPLTKLFQLGIGEEITELPTTLPALKNSGVGVADYNRDNYPDLILMGNDGSDRITRIFRNDQGGFTPLTDSIIGLEHGSAVWTDYNRDGELDFAIAGNKDTLIYQIGQGSISVTAGGAGWLTVHENDGTGGFREVGNGSNQGDDFFETSLNPIFSFADIDARDYDNDGDDDFILSGIPAIGWTSTGSGEGVERLIYRSIAQIMRNDGEAGYRGIEPDIPAQWTGITLEHHPLLNFECSTIGFVDTDNDNQLDIYRGGRSYGPAAVYKWPVGAINERPNQPEQLTAAAVCDSVFLGWNNAVDDRTWATELTYELYLQHQDSTSFTFSPVNDEELRSNQLLVRNLSPGTYRWGVQATDRAKAKSGFQVGPEFTISTPTAPTITRLADTLFSSAATGNQWYNDAGPILGATGPAYPVLVSGNYYCIVTVDGCSSSRSKVIDFLLTSIPEQEAVFGLEIWPSPAETVVYLKLDNPPAGTHFDVYNIAGQHVMGGRLTGRPQVNIRGLASGVYLLAVSTPNGVVYGRFLKE